MTKNEEIIIKEHFKVDDSHSKVRGFVFAYDDDNNLVFAKENMIVKSGRRFIMNNGMKDEYFSAAFLHTEKELVQETDVLSIFSNLERTDGKDLNGKDLNGGNIPHLTYSNFETWANNMKPTEDNDFAANKIYYFYDIENQKYSKFNIYFKTEDTTKVENKTYYFINDNEEYEEELKENFETGKIYYEKNIFQKDILFEREDLLEDKRYFNYFINNEDLVIKCMIIFNDTKSIEASSLGLVAKYSSPNYLITKDTSKIENKKYFIKEGNDFREYTDDDNFTLGVTYYERETNDNDEVLFSRLTFPTYFKSPTQRLTFRYYIYF